MKKKTWDVVVAEVAIEAAEAAESAFNLLNASGTASSWAARSDSKTISITGYFEKGPSPADVRLAIRDALITAGHKPDLLLGLSSDIIIEQDWLAEWKKGWKATRSGRFIIAPPWDSGPFPAAAFVIRIEPGMAFGTGTHETTRLCLAAIGDLLQPGCSVLDVGTGTGILAIAAAKMLGSYGRGVVGIDNDPLAVEIARQNALLNETPEIAFRSGTIETEKSSYDVVVANLTLDVILPALQRLLSLAKNNLILSGILVEQLPEITAMLKANGVKDRSVLRDGDWVAIIVARRDD
ncbi:MAG: hypothetical protein C4324_03390 [Blastocatellia bacterium]